MKLDDLIKNITTKHGKEAISQEIKDVEFVSSSSYEIDNILGGGYPKGRIIEFLGWESSGKSTLAMLAGIGIQQQGKAIGYVDMEQTVDLNYSKQLGVDISKNKFLLSQPDFGEQALEIAREMVQCEDIGMVVVDSVAALIPKTVLEGEIGEAKIGLLARIMSQSLSGIKISARKTGCIVIFINQWRDKINTFGFGDTKTTSGGNALKFYADQRIEVIRMGDIKDKAEQVIGQKIKVKTKKNKVFPPHKEVETNLIFGEGIDYISEIIGLAVEQGIIKKAGSWYSYGETKLGQGEALVKAILKQDKELFEEIKNKSL